MIGTELPNVPSSKAANVSTIRRFWDGFNANDLDVWDEVCAATFVNRDPGLPTPDADLSTIKRTIGMMLAAFPDIRSAEEGLIADGDTVATRRTMQGTHQAEFIEIAPTGKAVAFTGIWLARLQGAQMQEQWVAFDALGLLRQIGAIPEPG
jgi:predicted ester cyclase